VPPVTIKVWVGFLEPESDAAGAPLRTVEPQLAHLIDHEVINEMLIDVFTLCDQTSRQYVRQYSEPRATIQCRDCLRELDR
jgi:hypothetical protein